MQSRDQRGFWDDTIASRQRTTSTPIVGFQEGFFGTRMHHDDQISPGTFVSHSTSAPVTPFMERYMQRNSKRTTSQSEAATSVNILMPLPRSDSDRSQIMLQTSSNILPDDDMTPYRLYQQIGQDQSAFCGRLVVRPPAEYSDPQFPIARTQQIRGQKHSRPPMEIASPRVKMLGRRTNYCGYCDSSRQGNPFGHDKQNCPILENMPPCPRCGAFGPKNHTEMYCPQNKTKLRLKRSPEEHEKFMNNIRKFRNSSDHK